MKEEAGTRYWVALFDSVSMVMKAEKILKDGGISYKIIPVPKNISADCGVCIRFLLEDREAIVEALEPEVCVSEVRELVR